MFSFVNEGIESLGHALQRIREESNEEITSLNLHGNQIQRVEHVPEFSKLKVLRLSSNHIDAFTASQWTFAANLEYLDLASNDLRVSLFL